MLRFRRLDPTTNQVAVADSAPNDGEAQVIVGMSDVAVHMYGVAIDALPDVYDGAFADRAGVILAGLRKLLVTLTEAAGRSRT